MSLLPVIRISVGAVSLEAHLDDTPSAKDVLSTLPIEASFNTWGDEFYFEVPVERELDDTATAQVKVGDIGYWPPGRALAIFFGPTPMSTGSEPVAASEVNVIGRIVGDASQLQRAMNAGRIRLEKIEE